MSEPTFYLIAEPNGAGKSTFAVRLLRSEGCQHFVNADEIAKRLSPGAPESAAGPAARKALKELRQWAAERVRSGGHHIPTEDVHRRYSRSLHNLFELYLPISPSGTSGTVLIRPSDRLRRAKPVY